MKMKRINSKVILCLMLSAIMALTTGCSGGAAGTPAGGDAGKAAAGSTGAAINKTADVIVVGGGGAGLAAATSAAENGASVILIEKAAILGGNTARSGGVFNAVDPERQKNVKMTKPLLEDLTALLDAKESDFGDFGPTLTVLKGQIREYLKSGDKNVLFDSVELHMIHTYLGGKRVSLDGKTTITGKLDLVRTLCTNALGSIQWLEGYGLKWNDNISTVLGALWPRTHSNTMPVGSGYIKTLSDAAVKLGAEIMLETKANELIVENGKVVGVKATKTDGTPVTLRANKGVVMATGGFGANPEMRAKYNIYWEKMPLDMPTTNSPTATGDGIIMGEAVGANLVGMGFIQLMPSSQPVTGLLSGGLWSSAESQVFVNKEGKRFVNEYAERDVLSKAALKQTDSMFYIICDQVTAGNPQPGGKNGWGDNIDDLIKTKSVYKADTLEDLEKQLGMPSGALVAEIRKYNSYIDNQKDPDFGKKNFGPKLEKPPFYATPRTSSVHHTMGGLEIDSYARVLDKSGKVIPGFYAAGEVTGGIHAGNRLGGNAVADIITFGRIAGKSAAKAQ
ncbi:MAG: flavocytochrome c [Clostridiales bacterium]|jgi:fumarate reductase flavoprotein subunit|nr:flavocytochrome c [Eubacteriales bacterium]MDH7564950.1 flavocytochrome c [Clostridiales bacterium]